MDSSKKYDNPSPEATTNIISRLFFCWVLPFFKYGYKNDVQPKDIYNATKPDLSGPLGDELEKHWDEEMNMHKSINKKPSLARAIRKTFLKPYSMYGVYLFLQCIILKMMQPIVLALYINHFDKNRNMDMGQLWGWILGSAVVLMAFLNVLVMHSVSLGMQRIGMRCRIACCSLIYRKLLNLSRSSLGETETGQLVNLLSNDVQRFDIASMFLHYIWIMPIQTIIAAYVMYNSVGYSAFAGLLAITIQAVPLQGYLSRLQGKLRFKIAKRTDYRVKLMNEITSGIQVIKMYAWEQPFEKLVQLTRKHEIDIIIKTSYIRGVSLALMVFTERATLFLTLITFVLSNSDNKLTADVVFSMAQLFNTIQLYMSILFPMALSTLAEAKVSVRRLEDFLTKESKSNQVALIDPASDKTEVGSISAVKVSASWMPNPIVDTLIDLNFKIKAGSLVCVVGGVGSGKSSLLQLLLKELPASTGKLQIAGEVSYASQEPWLFVSNVRNNILFGQPYDKSRYKETVRVCALERDFEQFPHGDKTLVGERGVSMSGGQRARMNLARAVYRQADIYLFDDPLSAVDTHVGKHLFNECIKSHLTGKTRVLVTHQVQFLKEADLIIVLNNGRIEKIGGFNELGENELKELKSEPVKAEVEVETKRTRLKSIASVISSVDDGEEQEEVGEVVERGAIPAATYAEYYRAGASVAVLALLILLLIIAQMASNACDLWVNEWTRVEELRNATMPDEYESTNFYINIYTFFILAAIVLTTMRSLLFYKIAMKSSILLHNKMFNNVLQAPMRFFDLNPSGRILNRFSKDMGAIDEMLPRATLEALQIFLVMFGILAMVFIVTPWMVAPAVVLGVLFWYVRVIYLAAAQDVKRIEGTTRAPVFSHVSASLNGIPTIRAAKAQTLLIKEFDQLQDQHTGCWFLFIANSETFGFYLDVISVLFLALVTFQFLIFQDENTFSGNVGLVISQSLILTGMLQFGVRQTAAVAEHMTSVERVLQYTKLDKEGPFETPASKKPQKDWPSSGKIVFEHTYLKYAPGEAAVLKDLNIIVEPGEKIGIVGRTGAGKSTLIASLFRLSTNIEGSILIDGVDTNSIGLIDLRSSISIIPQEPILFSASVRYNLDPFEKCSDEELWKALENVELKNSIEDLAQSVSEGGSNFSAGQRQLVCLARAIVRKNKVLVMDEATANVDPQTDGLIQTTIRNKFKDCTVLTIAHRLNTIMDSDKVLVMDFGEAVEYAHPHELLQKPNGYFTKMLQETGAEMEAKLKKIAFEDFVAKGLKMMQDIKDKELD